MPTKRRQHAGQQTAVPTDRSVQLLDGTQDQTLIRSLSATGTVQLCEVENMPAGRCAPLSAGASIQWPPQTVCWALSDDTPVEVLAMPNADGLLPSATEIAVALEAGGLSSQIATDIFNAGASLAFVSGNVVKRPGTGITNGPGPRVNVAGAPSDGRQYSIFNGSMTVGLADPGPASGGLITVTAQLTQQIVDPAGIKTIIASQTLILPEGGSGTEQADLTFQGMRLPVDTGLYLYLTADGPVGSMAWASVDYLQRSLALPA